MAGSSKNFPAYMPILDGKNYDKWYIEMEVIFEFQQVSDIVKNGYKELGQNPTEAEKTAYSLAKKKDADTLLLIQHCVDSANFQKIASSPSSKHAWDVLNKFYTSE
ncbi:hypothetical protein CR513_28760, partial [Mucuna pruriens]